MEHNYPFTAIIGQDNMKLAIKKGEKVFGPGLLAQTNGNILYADESNLLGTTSGSSMTCCGKPSMPQPFPPAT